jgi:hypothetical protein
MYDSKIHIASVARQSVKIKITKQVKKVQSNPNQTRYINHLCLFELYCEFWIAAPSASARNDRVMMWIAKCLGMV